MKRDSAESDESTDWCQITKSSLFMYRITVLDCGGEGDVMTSSSS